MNWNGRRLRTRKLHYLGRLASRDVVIGPEVGKVVGAAGLARPSAGVARDNVPIVEPAYVGKESGAGQYIFEELRLHGLSPTERVGDDFG